MTPDTASTLPPPGALKSLARVGAYLRPYRWQVAAAAVALLVAAGAVLAIGQGLKGVIDRGFGAGNAAELDRTLALMLVVIVVMAVATFTRFYFVSWIGERVTADLRRSVFDHLLRLPPGWFEATRTGEVISRLTNDTAMLETVVGSSASMAVRNILWIGGHDVVAGRISAGQLSAFVFYAVIVAGAVGTISEVVGDLQRAAGATERLFELLAVVPEISPPANPIAFPSPARGTVAFEAVNFRYPSRPDTPALDGFTLDVRAGENVALVGPSGAGKTTVFQLLLRFYDPQEGTVRIDGVDLRRADPKELRTRLAVVPQDPVIFATSVLENVRYGRPDATAAEVRDACEAAYAGEFIAELAQGYDSQLGERGVRLSGGQRQRLAIARAILADRPILLLDEATSALDAQSERVVQLALERLVAHRTVLIIAHRRATR